MQLGVRNGCCSQCAPEELAYYKDQPFNGPSHWDKCDDKWFGNGWLKLWYKFKGTRNEICHRDYNRKVTFNKDDLMDWIKNKGYANGEDQGYHGYYLSLCRISWIHH